MSKYLNVLRRKTLWGWLNTGKVCFSSVPLWVWCCSHTGPSHIPSDHWLDSPLWRSGQEHSASLWTVSLEVLLLQFKQFAKLYLVLTLGALLGGLWMNTMFFIFSGNVLRHILNRHLIKCLHGSPFNLALSSPRQLYETYTKGCTC